jgi:hypothetical protein
MNPTKIKPFTQWARINRTERFVSVRPLSGYRIIQPEDDGYVIYLAPDASDEALGQALLEALARSRFIFPPIRTSLKRRDICGAFAIGRRISCSAMAIRPTRCLQEHGLV